MRVAKGARHASRNEKYSNEGKYLSNLEVVVFLEDLDTMLLVKCLRSHDFAAAKQTIPN
jgi:hypothetical protein